MALQVSPSASSKIRRARRAKSTPTDLPLACCRSSTISASVKFIVSSKEVIYYLFKRYGLLVSRHGSDVVGCAQPSERSARRIARPIPSVLASDATPPSASMASADPQIIGDATLGMAQLLQPGLDDLASGIWHLAQAASGMRLRQSDTRTHGAAP